MEVRPHVLVHGEEEADVRLFFMSPSSGMAIGKRSEQRRFGWERAHSPKVAAASIGCSGLNSRRSRWMRPERRKLPSLEATVLPLERSGHHIGGGVYRRVLPGTGESHFQDQESAMAGHEDAAEDDADGWPEVDRAATVTLRLVRS